MWHCAEKVVPPQEQLRELAVFFGLVGLRLHHHFAQLVARRGQLQRHLLGGRAHGDGLLGQAVAHVGAHHVVGTRRHLGELKAALLGGGNAQRGIGQKHAGKRQRLVRHRILHHPAEFSLGPRGPHSSQPAEAQQ
jgi:hypothetical protein